MDMNNFRAESHVAQQSRRDKLRVHQNTTAPTEHLQNYTTNFEQLPSHQELNPNFIQVRNFRYANPTFDGSVFSSEMPNFSTNSLILSTGDDGSCANPISSKVSGDPQNFGAWKSIGSPQCCDSIVNYSSGSRGIDESNPNHPMFVEEGLSGSLKATNISSSQIYMKPSYNGCQYTQKHYGEMHFGSPIYQNTLQDVVTSAATAIKGLEMASFVQSTSCDAYAQINRPVEDGHQWNGELGYLGNKSVSNSQGLSLSLSSVPRAKPNVGQFGDEYEFEHVNSRTGSFPCSKSLNPGCLMIGNTGQDVGISTFPHRNTGPLGPFTGYATILKNSKFLKPAQLLLDEFCSQTGRKFAKTYEAPDKASEEVRVCAYSLNTVESVGGNKGGDSGASSSTFRSSNEMSGECGVGFNSSGTYHPEYHQTKAKLIYMHEEVCKRFKQYHQQMQMVVSSFESVAGLSAATPYISLALKTVSRHFRSLKNAISDQLSYTRKALGEDMSSPTTGTSSCKGDTSSSRLNFVDHGFQKHKSGGGGNLGFFEPQQHVWRPQRGLPERAVAVLRAWLFDHFLHPYPTDTDKHMLATQTGLSRNQVSNWFINARVRVWKPMVEEIHTLETKNSAETNSNLSKYEGKQNDDQSTSRLIMNDMSNSQVECSEFGRNGNQWNQDKRSRTEYFETPVSMDGPVLGFVPYQRSGLEIGGLGPVSLTLGLRQSENGAQHQQEIPGQRLREQFGGQMIHDFVG